MKCLILLESPELSVVWGQHYVNRQNYDAVIMHVLCENSCL